MSLSTDPTSNAPQRRRQTRRCGVSIIPFLAKCGGIKPCSDLEYIIDGRFRHLVNRRGMTLDEAREKAVEAGFLHDSAQWAECESDSTINDLLELIDAEARGMKQYAAGEWPEGPIVPDKRDPNAKPDPRIKQWIGMTAERFKTEMYDLGVPPQSLRAGRLLGVSVRQLQRFCKGEQDVTDTVALLIAMYQRHGIPEDTQ